MDHPHPPSVIADRNGDQAVDRVPLLAVRQLTKRFGSLVANNAIDLDVHTGEIHAVLGENGAGKSTLMKLLYGFYQPDEGKLLWQGQPATLHSPLDGRRLGIGMVFQNFTLIPALTVIENIALFLPDLGRVLQPRVIAQRIKELATRYELTVPVYARVGDLSLGEQQKVEILKILLGGARVLIFDEPTSVLAPHEAEGLFRIFDHLRADGFALLFITHKMPEVLACADRITVLRRGAVAGTLLRAEATETKMVSLMLDAVPPKTVRTATAPAVRPTQPLLELRSIYMHNSRNEATLQDMSFTIWPGEIVGVAGVAGNGQQELGDLILGLQHCTTGELLIDGRAASDWSAAAVLSSGVGSIPEDPLRTGVVPTMTVMENMILGEQTQYALHGGLALDWARVQHDTDRLLNTTFINTPPRMQAIAQTLSGGNLQRVVIAREVGRRPRLLIAYYPARGLDLSNAEAARALLVRCATNGMGILLISEDLDELFTLSDRLLVLHQGQLAGSFRPDETDPHQVGRLMTGATRHADA